MREITKQEYLELYETEQISECFADTERRYGRTKKASPADPTKYEVVWCTI